MKGRRYHRLEVGGIVQIQPTKSTAKRWNPPNGSWGIVQILPTRKVLRNPGMPPTGVGGLFRFCLASY